MNNSFDKITLVIASSFSGEEKKEYIERFGNTAGCNIDIIFIENNSESLTKVYQTELEECKTDLIVFTHDDVVPLCEGWGRKLIDIFTENKQFGIVGVAGGKCYGIDKKLEWWYHRNQCVGMIFHGTETNNWFTMFTPYNTKSEITEVSVIDGVFMACVKSRLKCGFDTNIEGFHFYDIDFCISNFGHKGCKIGVTDRIPLRHESGGNPNDIWIQNGLKVVNKHSNKLPLKIFNNGSKKR